MMPALLTQMSTGPTSLWARSTTSASRPRSVMSTSYPRALPPWPVISAAVAVAPSALRSSTTILHPSAARAKQSALPRLRAPPVTRATRPLMPRSMLFAFELGGALLEEGLDPLARILRLENLLEGAHLDLDGLIDGRLDAIVHRLDDEARRDGRPLGDLARQGLGVVEGLALLGQAIDEADPVALLGG